jgi:hypothetical protein
LERVSDGSRASLRLAQKGAKRDWISIGAQIGPRELETDQLKISCSVELSELITEYWWMSQSRANSSPRSNFPDVQRKYREFHQFSPQPETLAAQKFALAALDLTAAPAGAFEMLTETAVFGYDWKPALTVPDTMDPEVTAAAMKLAALDGSRLAIAQFLLGGLIFGGFAQASRTRHYIQPKRSRLFLGVTAAQDKVSSLSAQAEDEIFSAAEVALRGGEVEFCRTVTLPPVLPYLLESNPALLRPEDLLAKALEFPTTPDGRNYVAAARALRADGVEARRVEDLSQVEHHAALEWLAPYSNLVPEKSQSLDIKLSSELIGLPGAEASFKLRIPRWLRIWWNDKVPFGGLSKTFRRMWMAEASYKDLAGKLYRIWSTN